MNIKAFRRLIKEAVAEAIYEQLPEILEEQMAKQQRQSLKESKTFSFTSQDIQGLPGDVRQGLASKMGAMFGHSVPQANQIQSVIPTGDDENQRIDLSAFFADSAANMTPQERAGLSNLG
jgi:hypothetical protein